MITRKHLLLAVAATCLLTTFVITIVPIRSQTAGQYDPWLDVNDDGKIDGKDIALPASIFGTAGDPTKDVNVINWPSTIQTMAVTNSGRIDWVNPLPGVSDGYHMMTVIGTTGFRKIYFSLVGTCNLTIGWRLQGTFNYSNNWWRQVDHYEEFETSPGDGYREFGIKGETLLVWLGDTYANSYEMTYYMTS